MVDDAEYSTVMTKRKWLRYLIPLPFCVLCWCISLFISFVHYLDLENNTGIVFNIAWSPDRNYVAFNVFNSYNIMGLYIIHLRDNQVYHVVDQDVSYITWSADSKEITFLINDNDNSYSLQINNLEMRPISGDVRSERSLIRSPDGKQIAYNGYRGVDQDSSVYVINSDGGEIRHLDPRNVDSIIRWSYTGENLMFSSFNRIEHLSEVHIYNLLQDSLISFPISTTRLISLSWSHNECEVAIHNREGTYILNICTSDQIYLGQYYATYADWSPNDEYLALTTTDGLGIVRRDGSNFARLLEIESQRFAAYWVDENHLTYIVIPLFHPATSWRIETYTVNENG